MGSCVECRFWASQGRGVIDVEDGDGGATAHRRCLKALFASNYELEMATRAESPMLTLDGSGYTASLYTLPTFGCLAFEPTP